MAAAQVANAATLLAVDAGSDYLSAAHDAVAHLVARFDREGLAAVEPRHGGRAPAYGDPERILRGADICSDLKRLGSLRRSPIATRPILSTHQSPVRTFRIGSERETGPYI